MTNTYQFLFDHEIEFFSGAIRQNPARLRELLAPDFYEFVADGEIWYREPLIEALLQETGTSSPAQGSDFKAIVLADGVVLLTYRILRADTESLRSSIWRKKNGQWQLEFHQGTKVVT